MIQREGGAPTRLALSRRWDASPATEAGAFRPVLQHLADRISRGVCAPRTATCQDKLPCACASPTSRSVTHTRAYAASQPISATTALMEVAVDLVRGVLADYPDERTISLLAISGSNLGEEAFPQLELPLCLADDGRRPGTRQGMARLRADLAVDAIRDRFGWEAVTYAAAMGGARSVPDAFRSLAEKDL